MPGKRDRGKAWKKGRYAGELSGRSGEEDDSVFFIIVNKGCWFFSW